MIEIELSSVSKRFRGPAGETIHALRDIDLTLVSGEMVIVVGPNGAGKSTLLDLLDGTHHPDAGAVTFQGTQKDRRARRLRQDPCAGSVGDLTLAEHFVLPALPVVPRFWRRAVPGARLKALELAMAQSALSAVRLNRCADELSYGQRQLLALEMVGRQQADLLLLDEPTASLDKRNARSCMDLAEELTRRLSMVTLAVTHDMGLAAEFGDRLLVLRDGAVAVDRRGEEKTHLCAADIFTLCGFDYRPASRP